MCKYRIVIINFGDCLLKVYIDFFFLWKRMAQRPHIIKFNL